MHHKIITSTTFFQDLLCSYFQRITQQVVETLLLLSVCHLFGLDNPNQVADALKLPKARLYRSLGSLSLYHAKCFNLRLGCAMAVDFISAMRLQSREGAYVSLGIKVMSYLMLLQISISERRTFHQIQLQLTGERQTLRDFITHFHTITPKEP